MGCKYPKVLTTPQIYFEDRKVLKESINPIKPEEFKSNIKLAFSLENVDTNHNYQIIAKFQGQNPFFTEIILGQSEKITFNKCFICSYFFEKKQLLDVSLLKDGTQYDLLKLTLGNIVGSMNSIYKGSFYNKIRINIAAEEISEDNSTLCCRLSATYSSPGCNFNEPEDKISYVITSSNNTKIYESESISSLGQFREIKIPLHLLKNGFIISFLDCNQESLSYKNEKLQQFCQPTNNEYLGVINGNKRINIINNSYIHKNPTFLDYIKNGVRIKLSIGIDYTESNLVPSDPNSLHYLGDNMNDYEQAIYACGMICAFYDYNQKFPVYGYGAFINGRPPTNMCFNINFKDNPEIYTINNVLKEYRNSFNFLKLAGPTNFSPLIQNVVDKIKRENNPMQYHILLILTDGIINDLQPTIDILVEGSFLPLSVIIIGIGKDDFHEMVILDGDKIPIKSSTGMIRKRDLVQFVEFDKFKNNPTKLSEQVLEEVPRQVIEYYAMKNIFPNNLTEKQNSNIPNSEFEVTKNNETKRPNTYQPDNDNGINKGQSITECIDLNIHKKPVD